MTANPPSDYRGDDKLLFGAQERANHGAAPSCHGRLPYSRGADFTTCPRLVKDTPALPL